MKIHAVVHARTMERAIENTRIAAGEGCEGVFLIDQGMSEVDVTRTLPRLRGLIPSVGVNLLSRTVAWVIERCHDLVDAIWSDHSGVEDLDSYSRVSEDLALVRSETGWKGLWFGGVCFKYGRYEGMGREDILNVLRDSSAIDVVTTSGPGTGMSASLSKIRNFREGLGRRPLAVASGITPENAALYRPLVDHALVGTGIEREFGELDPARVAALVAAST